MSKKETAIAFLEMAGTGNVKFAYDKYVASNFIHHNQYFKGDRASLMQAMIDAHASQPNKSLEIKFALEDGDKVMTFSRVVKEVMEIAVTHIFRFEGERIVELWDLGQIVSKDSPNENGAF